MRLKRLGSGLLALCLVLSMLPVTAFGTQTEEQTEVQETTAPATQETTAATQATEATTEPAIAVTEETEATTEATEAVTEPAEPENTVGQWTYEFYGDGLSITGYLGDQTDVYVPGVLTVEDQEYQVIRLGDRLFYDMDGLNSVTMGPGITEIGDEVFYDCDAMVCILPSEELLSIGSKAFYSCDSFNSIILYDALQTIAEDAFTDCTSLTIWCNDSSAAHVFAEAHSIRYQILSSAATPETYEQDGFTYYIMNGEAIAIAYDKSATTVTVPATVAGYPVTELRETFRSFSTLVSVTLPDTLKSIGEYTFYYCNKLKTVNIPERVTVIGDYAFYYCSALVSVAPASGLVDIGDYAFYFCSALKDFELADSVRTIGGNAFANCDSVGHWKIPEGVEILDNNVFVHCDMESISLPDSLKTIGGLAFQYTVVDSIVIPKNVTLIEYNAFINTKVHSITFNGTHTLVEEYGIHHVQGLQELIFNGELTEFEGYAISNSNVNSLRRIVVNGKLQGASKVYNLLSEEAGIEEIVIADGVTCYDLRVNARNTPYVEIPASISSGLYEDSFEHSTWIVYKDSYAHQMAQQYDVPYYVIDGENSQGLVAQDGVYYYIQNGEATAFSSDVSLTEATVASQINGYPVTTMKKTFFCRPNLISVEIPASITAFEGAVFSNCSKLKQVTLPEGVTKIDNSAFYNCTSLQEVNILGQVTSIGEWVFAYDEALSSITFPESLTSIGQYAFYQCKALPSVKLPDSVTELGDSVFSGCSGLTELVLNNTLTTIPSGAFSSCKGLTQVVIPENVTSIKSNAFYGCTGLQSIDLGEHLDSLGSRAFYNCSSLQHIVIPKGVTKIESGTFDDCTSLKSVEMLDEITLIGTSAFEGCKALESIDLPDSLTTIELWAFYDCDSLKSIEIPDSVTSIGTQVFDNCNNLESVVCSDGMSVIPEYAFRNCNKLTSITLPKNLRQIVARSFYNCTSLEQIEIPSTVTTIGLRAFEGCTALKTVTVPGGVSTISEYCFAGCTGLEEVVISAGCRTISGYAFSNCSSLHRMYLPGTISSINTNAIPVGTYLFVVENSYAHTFAVNNNYPYLFWDGVNVPEYYTQDGVDYVLYPEGAIAVSCDPTLTEVNIPVSVKEYPVVELRATFQDCTALTQVTLPEGLQIIGVNAFDGCTGLTQIIVPSTVTDIQYRAFAGCTALAEVILPDHGLTFGAYAFHSCTALTRITIPEGTIATSDYMFQGCSALQCVELPDSLQQVATCTFSNCVNLTQITLPEGLLTIGSDAFTNCMLSAEFALPESLTSLGTSAFYNCDGITKITIPDGVTLVSAYAFYACDKLEEVVISENVTEIGTYAFGVCKALHSVQLPDSLGLIKNYAFYRCESLRSIDLPEGDLRIWSYCFAESGLTQITIPSGVTGISENTFHLCADLEKVTFLSGTTQISKQAFYQCTSLQELTLPDTLEVISQEAFQQCTALQSVVLPASITTVEYDAFYGCSNLTELTIYGNTSGAVSTIGRAFRSTKLKTVTISGGKVALGAYAFNGVTTLQSVTIENDGVITSIGNVAFAGCSNLESINLTEGTTTIGNNAFERCSFLMAHVPASVTSMQADSFRNNVILLVYENSYAHQFAVENNLLYFIIRDTGNPEIAYGTGITGTVRYSGGGVAAGVNVELLYDDGSVKETVVTDSTGAYEFTYAEVGRYTVRVTDDNGKTAVEQLSVKRMNVFDVFLAGDTDLVLKTGWNVSGTVSKYPATVSITDLSGNVIESVTSEDGSFLLSDIPDGSYILKAQTESASVTMEITVYQSDLTGITLELPDSVAAIWGYVEVEARDKTRDRRNWVQVILYNSEGVAVAQTKSDGDGMYRFDNVPLDEYTIVAEVSEMRPDKHKGYKRSYTLTGYAYVNAAEAGEYQADTIVLYEENDHRATISGKVTAQGQTQVSEVILRNVFRHEVARIKTGKNGKYIFSKVRDGLYFITATTESDGMGMTMVAVRNGNVYGQTDITIYKTDKVKNREDKFQDEVPQCNSRDEVLQYRDRIAEEKRFYDGLSEKEKKQLSHAYVKRLNQYAEWLSSCEYVAGEDMQVNQGGLVVTGDELSGEDTVTFTLDVQKRDKWEVSTDGVNNETDYLQHAIEDTAGDRQIVQYYEISMTKDTDDVSQVITSVSKDTDATGKFRITLPIPEEYRGHKHYSCVHVHNGVTYTLVDMDDDPDTVTFEVGEFSTFALTYTDEELASQYETVYGLPYETIAMAGGDSVAYHIYGASGMILQIQDPGAYVIYNDVTYGANENGVVIVPLATTDPRTPAAVTVGNATDGVLVFTLTGSYPVGAAANPDTLLLGENTVTLTAGDTDGYCFAWTATDDGELTVTMDPESDWFYMVENLTAGVYSDAFYTDSEDTPTAYTLQVQTGDEIRVNVNTFDPEDPWNTPAGTVTFTAAFESYVIQVGQRKYPTMTAAAEAAQAGDTITLLADVTAEPLSDGMYEYDLDMSGLTLELNGNTLFVPKLALVFVGDDFTIQNGTVSGMGASYGLWIGGDTAATNVTAENVTTLGGINAYNAANVTLRNVNATGVTYYAVWLDSDVTNFAIESGSYTGADGKAAVLAAEGSQFVISGGSFSTEPQKAYCASGLVPVANADGTYGVAPAVAWVGETDYASLADAVAAAESGATVTLLQDASGAGVVINKDITIDFGGYTYTFTSGVGSTGTPSNGLQILQGNTVVLLNGTLNVAEENKSEFYILVQNYADLTVHNMTLDGTNLDKWSTTDGDSYTLSNNSGTVVITGETNIIANDEGDLAYAFDVCKYGSYAAPVVTVETTGTITGNIEVSEEINNNLSISGGSYTMDVTEWCAEGYETTFDGSAYTVRQIPPLFDLAGMTMSLGNSLAANFVVLNSNLDGDGYYAVITKAYANANPVTVTIPYADWQDYGTAGKYFAYTGVAAKEMTDVITVDVYNADGEQVMKTYTRTIEDYVYQMLLKATDLEDQALYVDILNYGAAAQDYFGDYSIDNLANARLTEEQKAWATGEYEATDIRVKGTGYLGSTVSLKNEISMNFVYSNAMVKKTAYAAITFTDHYGQQKDYTVQAEDFQAYGSSGRYIAVNIMAVADCSQVITVTLYDADGNALSTTLDSVASYVARMTGNSDEIYPAIMKLATSAYNYFHS